MDVLRARPANKHGLFQRGVSPTLEMRAKMSMAQRARYDASLSEDQRALDEFIAKVQRLLEECYRQIRSRH